MVRDVLMMGQPLLCRLIHQKPNGPCVCVQCCDLRTLIRHLWNASDASESARDLLASALSAGRIDVVLRTDIESFLKEEQGWNHPAATYAGTPPPNSRTR